MKPSEASKPGEPQPEELAQRFHEAYGRLAPNFGYRLRDGFDVPWAEVPEKNRQLMIAVCAELLREVVAKPGEPDWKHEWGTLKMLAIANADLQHAVSCMNRSCQRCNKLAKELEGEGVAKPGESRWISVQERLPDPETRLVYVAAIRENGAQMDGESFYSEEFGWNDVEDQGFMTPPVVTHWRPKPPLPDPPEELVRTNERTND
jgi:Protein of unknown function (DUF551)